MEEVQSDWRAVAQSQQLELVHVRSLAAASRLETITLATRALWLHRAFGAWGAVALARDADAAKHEALASLTIEREARRIHERDHKTARARLETRIALLQNERDAHSAECDQLKSELHRLGRQLEEVTVEKSKLEARASERDRSLHREAAALRSAILSVESSPLPESPSGAMGSPAVASTPGIGGALDPEATLERAALRRKAADLEADNALLTQNFVLLKARMSELTSLHQRETADTKRAHGEAHEDLSRRLGGEVAAMRAIFASEMTLVESDEVLHRRAHAAVEELRLEVLRLKGAHILRVASSLRAGRGGGGVGGTFGHWRTAAVCQRLEHARASELSLQREIERGERMVAAAEERAASDAALAAASEASAELRQDELLEANRAMGAMQEKVVEAERSAAQAKADCAAAILERRELAKEKDQLWQALQEARLTVERESQQRQSSRLLLDAQELRTRLEQSEREREQLSYSQAQMRARLQAEFSAQSRLQMQSQQAQQSNMLAQHLIAAKVEAARSQPFETPRTVTPRGWATSTSPGGATMTRGTEPEDLSRYQVSFSLY